MNPGCVGFTTLPWLRIKEGGSLLLTASGRLYINCSLRTPFPTSRFYPSARRESFIDTDTLAQRETPTASRWPASANHPPPPVSSAWAGWLLHGQPTINKDSRPVYYIYYCAATVWDSRAARLFRRLLEMVRSIMAPQLMHFHA